MSATNGSVEKGSQLKQVPHAFACDPHCPVIQMLNGGGFSVADSQNPTREFGLAKEMGAAPRFGFSEEKMARSTCTNPEFNGVPPNMVLTGFKLWCILLHRQLTPSDLKT